MAGPERDLMFILGGVLSDRPVTVAQQSWFFDGYGPADLDATRLAYFTRERTVEDVIGWAASVLDETSPPEGRAQALAIFRGLMTPTGIVATTRRYLERIDVG